MNKTNKLAVLSLFFAILPLFFLLLLSFSVKESFEFLEKIFTLLLVSSFIFAPSIAIILGIISLIKRRDYSILAVMGIIIGILGFIMSLAVLSPGASSKARDAGRESEIRQISLAQEIYYDEGKGYFQSENTPISIGNYLNPFPTDPGNGPCQSYKWISNINDSERFCAYACLEEKERLGLFKERFFYFAASHKGTKRLDKIPTNLDCW